MILVVKGVAKVSKRGSTIVVSIPDLKQGEQRERVLKTLTVPLLDLELLVIVGSRVRISSGVLLMLSEANIPVLIHSRVANTYLLNPFNVRIAEVRRRLYRIADDPIWRISVGRGFIVGKIKGMINVARYFAYKERERGVDVTHLLDTLTDYSKEFEAGIATTISTADKLRQIEAIWSKKLWEVLAGFVPRDYGFTGRDPRGRDPINSAINYGYAIIYTLCTHALIAAGLDPYTGIIHTERAGKASLTYDFSEMFKPVIIHATLTTSRTSKLELDKGGYLTKNSIEVLTREIYKCLKRKHREWKYTVRGEIYAKAIELRQNIEKGSKFEPFIYQVK